MNKRAFLYHDHVLQFAFVSNVYMTSLSIFLSNLSSVWYTELAWTSKGDLSELEW